MRIGYINETLGVTLTASSYSPGKPIENIQDARMTRKWESFSSGINTIDIPGQVVADLVCINAHNIQSGDTVNLKGYSDAGRTTLDTTVSITIRDYATAEVFTEKNLYWTFELTTAATVEIGGLFLGIGEIFPSYEIGHKWTNNVSDDVYVSATNQLYGANKFNYRTADYLLPSVTWDEQSDIEAWHNYVGRSVPFYLLQYTDRQDLRPLFYCHLKNDKIDWEENEKNIALYKDVVISIEEVF